MRRWPVTVLLLLTAVVFVFVAPRLMGREAGAVDPVVTGPAPTGVDLPMPPPMRQDQSIPELDEPAVPVRPALPVVDTTVPEEFWPVAIGCGMG